MFSIRSAVSAIVLAAIVAIIFEEVLEIIGENIDRIRVHASDELLRASIAIMPAAERNALLNNLAFDMGGEDDGQSA